MESKDHNGKPIDFNADDDPVLNCILAVCCPPESMNRLVALTRFLTYKGVDALAAESCAKVMLATFDLAPKGALQPYVDVIARLARGDNFKA